MWSRWEIHRSEQEFIVARKKEILVPMTNTKKIFLPATRPMRFSLARVMTGYIPACFCRPCAGESKGGEVERSQQASVVNHQNQEEVMAVTCPP